VSFARRGVESPESREKATLLRQRPGFTLADFRALKLSDNADFLKQTEHHLLAGLRKAGIPER
jgi:hypothetical protein